MKPLKRFKRISNITALITALIALVFAFLDFIYQGILYPYYLEKAVNHHQSTEYAIAIKEKGLQLACI